VALSEDGGSLLLLLAPAPADADADAHTILDSKGSQEFGGLERVVELCQQCLEALRRLRLLPLLGKAIQVEQQAL
jgi:hypothetical protein